MTITMDKAIKNLKAGRKDSGMIPPEEYTPTLDLASEALKLYKRAREQYPIIRPYWLPGETED